MQAAADTLLELFARNRGGERVGVYSVCSAPSVVIEAALRLAESRGQVAVIEATCNQVNQEGGYTGMQPADFAAMVRRIAEEIGFAGQFILGGDHLGPQPWRKLPAEAAMTRAEAMVDAYVKAGFTKIHLDCSMRCADDPDVLHEAIIAERAARLAQVAEAAAAAIATRPIYIIGTEVPPPGGMGEGHTIVPTHPDNVAITWQAHAAAFSERAQVGAFDRVAAIVVQPGLDFGNEDVVHFTPGAAQPLSAAMQRFPGAVFEAHSTDYQRPGAYKALVDGHFAILKVGPAATFALREALYALEAIEAELMPAAERSGLRAALEAAMIADPSNWSGHYHGTPDHEHYLRHFSFSDRSRYYWTVPAVEAATARLLDNLSKRPVPLPLISQYLPHLADAVADGQISADTRALAMANVQRALAPYADACGRHARAA